MDVPVDPSELMRRAARGDREAQADLTVMHVKDQEYEQAETMARLAAEHGDPNDLLMLAAVLLLSKERKRLQHGWPVSASPLQSVALAPMERAKGYGPSAGLALLTGVLSYLADQGDELAPLWLERIIAPLSPAEAGELNGFIGGIRSQASAAFNAA